MNKHIHLVGIGGIGMSGIAQLLLARGIKVSGSDLKESKITQELKKKGAEVFIGHNPLNIKDADLVVYSSAISQDNPELQKAKEEGISLMKRAEALAGLMRDKVVITVTGSHGKTTTTSLVSCLLLEAGFCPTVAIGGILKNIDTNAYFGNGKFFIAEADESDGSFLYYQPKYSIITNIDYEHLDYYQNFQNEITAFQEFLSKTEEGGCVFCCSDDANLKEMLKNYKNRYVLFGLKEDAHIYPDNIRIKELSSEFDCIYKNKAIGRFHLNLGGMHNISNSLSVIALGIELGIDLGIIKNALANYQGTRRRLDIKFSNKDYLIIDDYAHHPTEIKATLLATRDLKRERIIAVFQPHRYTRTKLLWDEFTKCFDSADYLIITDIYSAGEKPIEGINARGIYDRAKERFPHKDIHYLPKEEITEHILKMIKAGDLVITLGAGDIVKISDELAQKLKR